MPYYSSWGVTPNTTKRIVRTITKLLNLKTVSYQESHSIWPLWSQILCPNSTFRSHLVHFGCPCSYLRISSKQQLFITFVSSSYAHNHLRVSVVKARHWSNAERERAVWLVRQNTNHQRMTHGNFFYEILCFLPNSLQSFLHMKCSQCS
jgi:hypothetical protein